MSQGRTTELLETGMGNFGMETITDTLEHTGDYYWITVLTDATISAITLTSRESGNTLVGTVLTAGYSGPLFCSAITFSSGSVRMAKR